MPDQIQTYLTGVNMPQESKAQLWDHFNASTDENDLAQRLQKFNAPDDVKARLWDMKVSSKSVAPAAPAKMISPAGAERRTPTDPMGGLTKASHIGPGPSSAQEMGQGIVDTISDPKQALPIAATGLAALGTEGMSIPASASIMAGVNAAGTAVGHGLTSMLHPEIPQPPLGDEMTWSAAMGATPEILGGIGRGPRFFKKTFMGQKAQDLLGDKAGLHEVTQHPIIDWMHNIATAGMGGSGRMEAHQTEKSAEELHALVNTTEEFAPASGAKMLRSARDQGGDIRTAITDRLGKFYSNVVQPAYENFGAGKKYGSIPIVMMDSKGSPVMSNVNEVLAQRSEIGKQLSYTTDRMERKSLGDQYENYTKLIDSHLPPDAKKEWEKAKSAQQFHSKVWENPTVDQILQSPTKENEILSLLYNPQGGGDLGGKSLKTWDQTIKPGGRPTQVSYSNAQLVNQARAAMGKDEWQHTAVAAAQHIVEAATNENGILDGARLKKLSESMDPEVKAVLFGVGPKSANFDDLINTIAYAERKPKSSAGTLFINIRQGAAIMGGMSALGGAVGGMLDGQSGAESGAAKGAIASVPLLLAPNMMARMLTSPIARDWLVRASQAATPTIRDRMLNAAIKVASQGLGRSALKAEDTSSKAKSTRMTATINPDQPFTPPSSLIPEPPR